MDEEPLKRRRVIKDYFVDEEPEGKKQSVPLCNDTFAVQFTISLEDTIRKEIERQITPLFEYYHRVTEKLEGRISLLESQVNELLQRPQQLTTIDLKSDGRTERPRKLPRTIKYMVSTNEFKLSYQNLPKTLPKILYQWTIRFHKHSIEYLDEHFGEEWRRHLNPEYYNRRHDLVMVIKEYALMNGCDERVAAERIEELRGSMYLMGFWSSLVNKEFTPLKQIIDHLFKDHEEVYSFDAPVSTVEDVATEWLVGLEGRKPLSYYLEKWTYETWRPIDRVQKLKTRVKIYTAIYQYHQWKSVTFTEAVRVFEEYRKENDWNLDKLASCIEKRTIDMDLLPPKES